MSSAALVVQGQGAQPRPEDEHTGLPYIDSISPEEQAVVERLLQEEAARGPKQPGDYLKELPPMPQIKFQGRPALQAEWARVRAGNPMDKLAFGNTMAPEPAQAQQNSVKEWRDALDNASTQLEHQHNWLLNLELAQKFAPKAWQANVASLDAAQHRLTADLEHTEKLVNGVNIERSLRQQGIAGQLQALEADWTAQVSKNQQIEAANLALEERIAQARRDQAPSE